jgi:hypothetical protein
MRHISFALTADMIRAQTKTVTRRLGWRTLGAGTLLQPVIKTQGMKRGERVTKIDAPIRVVSVRRERLDALLSDLDYGILEVQREGFERHPMVQGSPHAFVDYFCNANRCARDTEITRIEFEYFTL